MNIAQNLDNSHGGTRLDTPIDVGPVRIPNRVFLAPMSGVTDVPFRDRASAAGAGLVVSEMVASQEFVKGSAESSMRSKPGASAVRMVQLAGREAYWMGEAAKRLEQSGVDLIDINMGCPAKKVTGGYSGSALMRDLDHALTLIEAIVSAARCPVTLKMRLGWDDHTINAPQLARRAVDAGISMITVHGRTRCQFYTGSADWGSVRAVREAVDVPLVVNGDIVDLTSAQTALKLSGADAVMIGRGSYGQPWFPGMLAAHQFSCPDNLGDYVAWHYEDMLVHYGLETGVRHARKHLGWYLARHAPSTCTSLKSELMTSTDPVEVAHLIRCADWTAHTSPHSLQVAA
jgi:nifR3 family TIM-barrel protein